jgi:hypothetical protein
MRARGRAHGPMLDSRATTVRLCRTMGPPLDAQALLRAGVLEGTSIVCAGSRGGPFGEEVARACTALGARVTTWAQGEEAADAHVLCYDGAAAFSAKAGERERSSRRGCSSCTARRTRVLARKTGAAARRRASRQDIRRGSSTSRRAHGRERSRMRRERVSRTSRERSLSSGRGTASARSRSRPAPSFRRRRSRHSSRTSAHRRAATSQDACSISRGRRYRCLLERARPARPARVDLRPGGHPVGGDRRDLVVAGASADG